MAKDAHASLRLPAELKREVEQIADKEVRPVSSTLELLVRRGLVAYRKDGHLLERISSRQLAKDDEEAQAFAEEMADLMMQSVASRIANRQSRKKSKRA